MRSTLFRKSRWWITPAMIAAIIGGLVIAMPGHAAAPATSSPFARCIEPFAGHTGEALTDVERECHAREAASKGLTPARALLEEQALHASRAAWLAAGAAEEAAEPSVHLTGIKPGPEGPPGTNQTFASTGCWIGEVSGQWYQVYAGTKTTPGTGKGVQSELLVYHAPAKVGGEERAKEIGAYTPPEGGTGVLEITAVEGRILTIKTVAGASLKFNVATHTYE